MNEQNYFTQLYSIDVSEHVEQKEGLGYLSWAKALHLLLSVYPSATWETVRFQSEKGVELPFLRTEVGYFVEVAVTVEGIRRSQLHPVLDEWFAPIMQPTSFDINTSIQRALVKAIALHGLGLHVYLGEQVPSFTDRLGGDNESPEDVEPVYKLDEVKAVEGNSGPYYVLRLLDGEKPIEVAVCNEVMEMFENSNINLGDHCHVGLFEHTGKMVASDIRKAS
jgi:hypothetical protein